MYYIPWLLIRIQTNHLKTANDDIALIRVHLINKSCSLCRKESRFLLFCLNIGQKSFEDLTEFFHRSIWIKRGK